MRMRVRKGKRSQEKERHGTSQDGKFNQFAIYKLKLVFQQFLTLTLWCQMKISQTLNVTGWICTWQGLATQTHISKATI